MMHRNERERNQGFFLSSMSSVNKKEMRGKGPSVTTRCGDRGTPAHEHKWHSQRRAWESASLAGSPGLGHVGADQEGWHCGRMKAQQEVQQAACAPAKDKRGSSACQSELKTVGAARELSHASGAWLLSSHRVLSLAGLFLCASARGRRTETVSLQKIEGALECIISNHIVYVLAGSRLACDKT